LEEMEDDGRMGERGGGEKKVVKEENGKRTERQGERKHLRVRRKRTGERRRK